MNILSKLANVIDKDFSCYEIAHTWHPDCFCSASIAFMDTTFEAIKVYAPLFMVSFIMQRKKLTFNTVSKYFQEVMTSSLFLGYSTSGFLASFCVLKYLFGRYSRSLLFIAALITSFITICFERPTRRQALAVYVANIASETFHKMLVSRKLSKNIQNGHIWIMCLGSSILLYMYENKKLQGVISYIFDFFFSSNIPEIKLSLKTRDENKRKLQHQQTSKMNQMIKGFLSIFKNPCKIFLISLVCCSSLGLVDKMRKFQYADLLNLREIFLNRSTWKFSMFLGSFIFLYNFMKKCEVLFINSKSKLSALPSGFVAGFSLIFYQSPSIALYLLWKAIEALWIEFLQSHPSMNLPFGIEILYSVSTALLMVASIVEAHNIRPAYIQFLKKISNNKLKMVNRILIEIIIGGNASKVFPFFPVVKDLSKSSEGYQKIVKELSASGILM